LPHFAAAAAGYFLFTRTQQAKGVGGRALDAVDQARLDAKQKAGDATWATAAEKAAADAKRRAQA
jgi:hypothetical protein